MNTTIRKDIRNLGLTLFAILFIVTFILGFTAPSYSTPLAIKVLLSVILCIYVVIALFGKKEPFLSLAAPVVLIVSIYWLLMFFMGFFTGFSINASSPTIRMALINTVLFTPILVARAFLPLIIAEKLWIRESYKQMSIIMLSILVQVISILTLPELLLAMKSGQSMAKIVVQEIIPQASLGLAIGVLLSLREYPAIVFFVLGAQSPLYAMVILPNLNAWFMSSSLILLSIIIALTGYVHYAKLRGNGLSYLAVYKVKRNLRETISTIALGLIIIAVISSGYRPLVVVSNSMSPTIERGDIVFVSPVNPEDIDIGDVIAFYKKEYGIIVHRVISVQRDNGTLTLVTKGDANNVADEPVSYRSIVGKVIVVVPSLGKIILSLRETPSLINSLVEELKQNFLTKNR